MILVRRHVLANRSTTSEFVFKSIHYLNPTIPDRILGGESCCLKKF